MVPLILCSLTALTIIINKWRYLNAIKTDVTQFKAAAFALLRENKIKAAIFFCENHISPAARVLKAGLLRFGSGRDEIREEMENAMALEIPQLEKGLTPLITIANAAPLFGVAGTVLGLIIIFQTIQNQSAGMRHITPADFAGGIWQALLTTLAGLIVAIPSFVAYNYFLNYVHHHINELNRMNSEVVNLLTRINESINPEAADTDE